MTKHDPKSRGASRPRPSSKPRLHKAVRADAKPSKRTARSRTSARALTSLRAADQAALLQLTHDSIIVRDLQDRITFWNRGAAERYGWSEGEALGQTIQSLLPTLFPEPLLVVKRILMDKGHWEGELVRTCRDGARITVASRWALQCDARGKPTAILEVDRDMSERKRAEDEIKTLNGRLQDRTFELQSSLEQMGTANEELTVANQELAKQIDERMRAEERASRLASFPELNPRPIIEVDTSGSITYANSAAHQTLASLGVEPREVQALLPDDLGAILKDWDQKTAAIHLREIVVKNCVFGETVTLIPQFKVARVYAYDITERKRAEEALRESEMQFQALVETTSDFIWEIDARGAYTYCSPQIKTLWGLDPKAMVGKSPFDLLVPEDRVQVGRMFSGLAGSAAPFHDLQVRSFDARGDVRSLEINGVPFFGTAGELKGFRGITRDITERKRAEEALRRSEQQYRDLVESANSIIMRADGNLNITYMNPFGLQFFGYTAEELIGKSALGTTIPLRDDAGNDLGAMARDITENPDNYKTNVHQNMRKNGELVWVSWTNKVTNDPNGKVIDILAIGNDITERRHAEEQLQHVSQILAHHMENSPLAVIEWGADMRLTRWSGAAETIFGWKANEVLGKRMEDFRWVYLDDEEQVRKVSSDLRTGADPHRFSANRNFRKDGSIVDCEWYNSSLVDASGKLQSILSLVLDVTDRKNAEKALVASSQRLAQVLDGIQDDFYVLDRDWKFVFASRQFTSRIGKDAKDFVGNCIWDMFPRHLGTSYEENLRATMEKREIRRFEIGGKYTDAWYAITCFPSADGVTVLGTDITARKRIETQVQHRNAVLAGINRIFQQAMTSATDEELGVACLQVAEEVTGSKFGFVAELNAQGTLDDIAISDPGWDQCRILPRTVSRRAPIKFTIHGLYGKVIVDGKGYYTNDPPSHPDSIGLPSGHPPLTAFLGVPLVHNGKTFGMIGLGNREGGYSDEELEAATSLANVTVQALMRKRAEQAMQASEARERARSDELATVLDAVPAVVWIAKDPLAMNVYGNRVAQELLDIPAGTNMSKSAPKGERPETFDVWKDGALLRPEDMPVQRAARGEEIRDYELEIRFIDGTVRTMAGNATPLRDREGKPYGAVSAFIDITQRKHTEVALQQAMDVLETWTKELEIARADAESEKRLLQAVMDALPVGVAILNEQGGQVRSNQAFEQVWGGSLPRTESVADYAAYQAWWAGTGKRVEPEEWASAIAVRTGEPVVGQLVEIQRFDRTRGWVINSASPVRDSDGNIMGCAVAIQDITELRRAEESLREAMHRIQKLNVDMAQRSNELEVANEELERLAMSLAYDLRAPLISINSISKAILQDHQAILPPEAGKLFELIHANTKEMDDLTNGLVRLMRITRQPVQKQTLDMMSLIRKLWDETASQRSDRQVELTMRLLPPCDADPALMHEVWSNLISNALKFTRGRTPARIEIGTRRQEGQTVYFIRDNGAGFDMAYAGRIFRAFQRYHHADEFEGSGVGLAIVEGIIRRHGGRIWAEGAVDQGATFYLTV